MSDSTGIVKAIGHIIMWKTGGQTDKIGSHFVFHGVVAAHDIGRFKKGSAFPTAIVDAIDRRLILIDERSKEHVFQLHYSL